MSRLQELSLPFRMQLGATAHRLARFALALLIAGPLALSVSACASSSEKAAPERDANQLSASKPYVHASRGIHRSTADWQRLDDVGSLKAWRQLDSSALHLHAASALVVDEQGRQLYAKNARQVKPIASITKLMTAMVVLDTGLPLDRLIQIAEADRDRLKNSRSRLRIGEAKLSRKEMIMVSIMSSDNRAAHALGRTTYRGGTPAFIQAMNRKAKALGMHNTRFVDSSGLDPRNRSTAEDLVKMLRAASEYPLIRATTSRGEMMLHPVASRPQLRYRNTNPLVRSPEWAVEVSKTGFINEAGRCLVMRTRIDNQRLYMVFLGGNGRASTVSDSKRVRDWVTAANHTASR